jgi:hypothetical protein
MFVMDSFSYIGHDRGSIKMKGLALGYLDCLFA